MLKATTKARRHEESQRTFRVFVSSWLHFFGERCVQTSRFFTSASSAASRLRSAWSPSFGEARRSASGAKAAALIVLAVLSGAACRQDMHDQPKYIPLRESTFFVD